LELEKGKAIAKFCPLPARVFKTLEIDLTDAAKPLQALLAAIAKENITDKVIRLVYKLRADQVEEIDNLELGEILAQAHSYTIQTQLVSQLSRPRLPELGVDSSLSPMTALQAYLNNREDLEMLTADILEAAQGLLNQDPHGDKAIVAPEDDDEGVVLEEESAKQLRLL